MRRHVVAVICGACLLMFFQNCSSSVAFDPETATAASTDPGVDPGTAPGADSDPVPEVTPPADNTGTHDVLNNYNFTDVTKITFDGYLDLAWAGYYEVTAALALDHSQHSFNANFGASGVYPIYWPISCHSQGTLSEYNDLENAMQNISFNITHSSTAADFVSATMKVYLRNGTVKSYVLDTSVQHISVDNATHIDAKAFKSLIKGLIFNSGCSH